MITERLFDRDITKKIQGFRATPDKISFSDIFAGRINLPTPMRGGKILQREPAMVSPNLKSF